MNKIEEIKNDCTITQAVMLRSNIVGPNCRAGQGEHTTGALAN